MYLRNTEQLYDLLSRSQASAVILNAPDGDTLSLASVLQHLLEGRTHSFTALVGYFGHRIQADVIERYQRIMEAVGLDELEGEDPAGLIVHEAIEENVQHERDFEHTAFRLLAGAMSSDAAKFAARAWYWLCRFRHEAPEGREATEQLRSEFIRRAAGPDDSFVDASYALLESDGYETSPFRLTAREFATRLDTSDSGTEQLAEVLETTLFDALVGSPSTSSLQGAAILFGFFLQRRTDFRLNPQQDHNSAIFHPKVYVVERGGSPQSGQTGTIVGSHNWTTPGLGLTADTNEPNTNVEVATLHLDEGHNWTNPADEPSAVASHATLGPRVCGTARHLFETARYSLGAWQKRPENLLPADRLEEAIENRAARLQDQRDAESRETFRSLLVYLRHLVAGLGHINLDDQHDEFFDRFRLTGNFRPRNGSDTDDSESHSPLFGGKIPASYQVDGAIRLLSILEGAGDSDGSRGAFLTDEAGLGKTLSAKMTLSILAATRLARRRDVRTPLTVSLIVPAALTGTSARDGRAPSGWHLHAREIRRATYALLADVCDDIEPDEARRLSSEEHLRIRVISHGIFSPGTDILPDAPTKRDIPAEDVFEDNAAQRLDDFRFIAESELVAIDESHAFRNQRSRRTRTLRLLLSLPVPGETDWELVPPNGESPEPSEDFPDGIRRRVLCLSATPFNNRIEDIITQIGHFAQYQNWQMPYGTVGQLEFSGNEFQRPLDDAIATWNSSPDPVGRADAFRTIVKYARRHLHRTRALSVPADQLEEQRRQGNTDELRSRYDDLGPEYIWGDNSRNYRTAFAKALEWLNDEERDDEQSVRREQLDRKRFEARQELESVLTSLFVQRSRIRALRIIEAAGAVTRSTTDDSARPDASSMFRKPRRPRQPLALNRHHRAAETDEQTLEASILDNLFRFLYPSASDQEGTDESAAPHLSLKAYEISALRGQRSAQAARNAIGFQITNLIKRLQSSPYSFFRTLVNGVFRRSLTELALVERLLDDVDDGNVELPGDIDAERLRQQIDAFTDELNTGRFGRLPNVVQLIGGHIDPHGYGRPSLKQLVGLQENTDGQLTHPHAQEVDEHYDELLEILSDETQPLLWSPDAADDLAEDERQGWVSLLLEQLDAGLESELWRDIVTVLEVTEQLSDQIWGRGNQNVGKPFDIIWRDFLELPASAASGVADWLADRLDADERTRTLTAWLLVQSAARTASEETPARAKIRGGSRTLIFTEYKDTQDYLLALFAALHLVFRDPGQTGRHIDELRSDLLEEMRRMVTDLHNQSERVAAADVDRFHFADPTQFASPVIEGTDGWFDEWLDDAADDPELFATAVRELAETFVRVHGDEADRLLTADDIRPRVEPTDEALSVPSTFTSQVDAFSPWYQLEPESDIDDPGEALGYIERLREAAAFPVNTLLTTDVLAEGVNLQECGVVVHFDLPWNPTKLIQRNGRIDRRLNPVYERHTRRSELHENLVETASESSELQEAEWAAPPFHPPEQVYHLTVLPIEPRLLRSGADPALATRVRESLQSKLEAIRTLFGLSNWPIVLTYEDTQEVLTGELDFETPGFRRREDLFAAFRQLEDSATEANERFKSIDARVSLHLRAPAEARTRLVELFADPDDADVADAWRRVRAAGIVSWTKPRPRSMTVRSDNEWLSALETGLGAVSGVLVVEDEDAAGGFSFVTWGVARGTSARDTTGRRILPAYIRPTDVDSRMATASFLELTRLKPLDDWNSLEGAAPNAPSELAADLVKTIIDLAVDGADIAPGRERKDDPYPTEDIELPVDDQLTEFLRESSFLNTVIDAQLAPVSARPGFGSEPNPVALRADSAGDDIEHEPAFNLWLTFED